MGKGQGIGKEYKPWIDIQSFPSAEEFQGFFLGKLAEYIIYFQIYRLVTLYAGVGRYSYRHTGALSLLDVEDQLRKKQIYV